MKKIEDLKVQIFADGADKLEMLDMYSKPYIKGMTTNPTLMKKVGITDYRAFSKDILTQIKDKPLSFEVFSDDFEEMERQAIEIASWGENVYVKIPVINSRNESNLEVIRRLLEKNIKVNITCVFTKTHIDSIYAELNGQTTPFIVSVFAGSIADTGVEPYDTVKHAVDTFAMGANVEILWAGVKEIMAIKYAIDYKCHIITVPDAVFDRFSRIGLNLEEMACNKVKSFNNEAENIRII